MKENGTISLATYDYDTLSRVTLMTLGNGASTSFTYEDDSALDTLSHLMPAAPGGAVAYGFDYNNVNQLTSAANDNAAYNWVGGTCLHFALAIPCP